LGSQVIKAALLGALHVRVELAKQTGVVGLRFGLAACTQGPDGK
jgi:hypothetical protein